MPTITTTSATYAARNVHTAVRHSVTCCNAFCESMPSVWVRASARVWGITDAKGAVCPWYRHHVTDTREPVPFVAYERGVYLHGTKANLAVGELLVSGRGSNFEEGRVMNYVYFTATLDAATWGAELAVGEGRGRIYVVEPMGEYEDDPNVTNKKFPGNPTLSFRSRAPLRVVGELVDWVGHPPDKLQVMLGAVQRKGAGQIED
jgi:rifampin ADP-ribosylating transferase